MLELDEDDTALSASTAAADSHANNTEEAEAQAEEEYDDDCTHEDRDDRDWVTSAECGENVSGSVASVRCVEQWIVRRREEEQRAVVGGASESERDAGREQ